MIPTGLLPFVDHAAARDDRWLFVASLVVFGGFSAVVMRDFVHQHERRIVEHKQARDTYQESLRGMVAEQSMANAKLITCLESNTRVLSPLTEPFPTYHWTLLDDFASPGGMRRSTKTSGFRPTPLQALCPIPYASPPLHTSAFSLWTSSCRLQAPCSKPRVPCTLNQNS
jgi:hypothetical protein